MARAYAFHVRAWKPAAAIYSYPNRYLQPSPRPFPSCTNTSRCNRTRCLRDPRSVASRRQDDARHAQRFRLLLEPREFATAHFVELPLELLQILEIFRHDLR